MKKINAPCFKCKARSAECHTTCEQYKAYQSYRGEVLQAEIRIKNAENDYIAHVCDYIERRERRKGKNDKSK